MVSKIQTLTDAIDRYGDVSMEIYSRVKALGSSIRDTLPLHLGDQVRVYGVPPQGEWRPDNYHDAMFSYHGGGTISVGPAQLGLAVQIPHKKDEGSLWVRVTLEIAPRPTALIVSIGDSGRSIEVDEPHTPADVSRVCEAVYQYLLSLFDDPVALATAEGRGKIGFMTS